jgi:hypothetical protein
VCSNIPVGTSELAEFDYECRSRSVTARGRCPWVRPAIASKTNRICILRRYAWGMGFRKPSSGTLSGRFILKGRPRFVIRRPPEAVDTKVSVAPTNGCSYSRRRCVEPSHRLDFDASGATMRPP